jgi:hypothetical protein
MMRIVYCLTGKFESLLEVPYFFIYQYFVYTIMFRNYKKISLISIKNHWYRYGASGVTRIPVCRICDTATVSTIFQCGHTICIGCAIRIKHEGDNNCPLCRTGIRLQLRIGTSELIGLKCNLCRTNDLGVFVPCRHMIVCDKCYEHLKRRFCAMCDTSIISFIKIF